MRVVSFSRHGDPNVLKERKTEYPIPKDNEVLIKVAASGVSRQDIWRRRNGFRSYFDCSPYLGYECSGEVVDTGSQVVTFKKADKVCAIARGGGGYAEFVAVPEMHTAAIPRGVNIYDSAALPQASCLVAYCFSVLLKNFSRGRKILIHGASGGFGTIAIQYARHHGFEVFATTGSEEKVQICSELGAKVCINRKKENFWERVKTEVPEGVDVIIDVLGGYYFKYNMDCLCVGGTFITIGDGSGIFVPLDLKFLKTKQIKFSGACLRNVSAAELGMFLREAERRIWPLLAEGHIKPIIGEVYKFEAAPEAHRAMEKYCLPGKLLLIP